jgi:glycosyltransferase involved in cell wall biosynthesis
MTPNSVPAAAGQILSRNETASVAFRRADSGRPKVSVMVITYNHEKYIAQALESVLMQQADFHFEINVIEDCSTDRTQEIIMRYVRQYPDIVKPFFNKKNIGFEVTQKNFYRGFLTLTGEYLAILEGDDYWTSPHKLQKQVDFLDANLDFALCTHNTVKIYEDGSRAPHRFLYWGKLGDCTVEDVICLRWFFHTTGILYRNVFNGVPPRQFRNKWSCDIFILIAHATYGKGHHIDEDMAVYRAHSGGRFSGMKEIDGWLFNVDGLRRYNAWLGYRYCRTFAESISKYCRHILKSHGKNGVAPLSPLQHIRIRAILAFYSSFLGVVSLPKRLRRMGIRLTPLAKLPTLPDWLHWDLIWGLNAVPHTGRRVVVDQPLLRLTAHPQHKEEWQDRHALSQRIDGLTPGETYRVTIWVKPLDRADLQVHVRDSVNPATGVPDNQGEARVDLSAASILTSNDGLAFAKVAPGPRGWLKVSVGIRSGDGRLFVYLGLLKGVARTHAFDGDYEKLLFGGLEVNALHG